MGLERYVRNPDDRKINKIKLATQMLSRYIFELYTCVRVQKCNKNKCIHTLAPGGRPCVSFFFAGGALPVYDVRNCTFGIPSGGKSSILANCFRKANPQIPETFNSPAKSKQVTQNPYQLKQFDFRHFRCSFQS
jgi:hypothetical protein